MTQYIKPLNVIHPFYYPQLATCPRCGSDKENICKESAKMKKGNTKNTPGDDDAGAQASETADLESYCFATTSAAYWRTWEHWRIPREFHASDIQNAPRT
jgi:hypothetical protein